MSQRTRTDPQDMPSKCHEQVVRYVGKCRGWTISALKYSRLVANLCEPEVLEELGRKGPDDFVENIKDVEMWSICEVKVPVDNSEVAKTFAYVGICTSLALLIFGHLFDRQRCTDRVGPE